MIISTFAIFLHFYYISAHYMCTYMCVSRALICIPSLIHSAAYLCICRHFFCKQVEVSVVLEFAHFQWHAILAVIKAGDGFLVQQGQLVCVGLDQLLPITVGFPLSTSKVNIF